MLLVWRAAAGPPILLFLPFLEPQVIEEAPAPGISADFRRSIGESAVAAAKAGEARDTWAVRGLPAARLAPASPRSGFARMA